MNKTPQEKSSHGMGIGLGIATLAATIAGAYYLYGSDKAAKNRKHVKSWMLNMKADVMDQVEHMTNLTKDTYEEVIDTVSKKYTAVKSIDTEELADLVMRMKSHWKDIHADISETMSHEAQKLTK
jgi:hypothetical protein